MDSGTYTQHLQLGGLPLLVRRQRRLEAQIVPLGPLLEQEKAVRKAIDVLLVAAGLQKSETVTCNGYDVTHIERAGQSSLNQETIVALLTDILGVDETVARQVLVDSTEKGDPSLFCTVKPSKGAAVRKARP
jgi:hypothetical protein